MEKMVKIVKKPWGKEKHFIFNTKCTVKILIVKPKQMLSLQRHKLRKELWHFLTPGMVQIGSKKKKIKKGEIVNIGKGKAHRIISGKTEVRVLEISYGKFDSKDIIRLEDKYGRVKK